jgi:hypothetical protein
VVNGLIHIHSRTSRPHFDILVKGWVAAALAVLVALSFGCGRNEPADKSAAKAPRGISAERGVDLPADFPSDVPMPKAGTLKLAMSQAGKSYVQVYTPDSVADAGKFYKAALEAAGWQIVSAENTGDMFVVSATKGAMSCGVTISKDGKKTLVRLVVTQKSS